MMSGAFDQKTTVVRTILPATPAVSLGFDRGATIDWATIDDAIAPSVVNIDVSNASGPASGSGLVFMAGMGSAYVITDSALIAGVTGVQVTFLSGGVYAGKVVGADSTSGLALIAVPNVGFAVPTLGSVGSLKVANPVLAVGARTDSGGSVFPGWVSVEDRQVEIASGSSIDNLIGLSIPSIPSAAAGGPLVDQQGRVVGVTVSVDPMDSSNQNLSFAVPVDVAEHVAAQLLAGEAVTHPWLGVINTVDISSGVANQLNLSGGVQVGQVTPGSPASRVGLNPSDIITGFGGQPVTSSGSFTQLLSQAQPGRSVMISYLHRGKPVQSAVYVSDQPSGS
jgi:S1-C subfamily serine protease